MHEAYIITLQILPGPIYPRKFAVSRILERDIISLIVLLIAEIKGPSLCIPLALGAYMYRKIKRILRHSVFFMCSYDDRSAQRFL